jgi:hypothetical protein
MMLTSGFKIIIGMSFFWKISKVILKALIDNASDPEEGEDLIETAGKDYQRIESLDAYRRDGVASTVVFHQC